MNIGKFFEDVSSEIPLIKDSVNENDELITSLYSIFTDENYDIESIIELIKDFIKKIKKYEDDEKLLIFDAYVDTYKTVVYDQEKLDDLNMVDEEEDLLDANPSNNDGMRGNEDEEHYGVLQADDEGYVSYPDFAKDIINYTSKQSYSWLQYLSEDDNVLKEYYTRVALGGANYDDANTFISKHFHALNNFLWSAFEYYKIDDDDVPIEYVYGLANWYINDYYNRNDVYDDPDFSDEELKILIDSDEFFEYYKKMYGDGLIDDVEIEIDTYDAFKLFLDDEDMGGLSEEMKQALYDSFKETEFEESEFIENFDDLMISFWEAWIRDWFGSDNYEKAVDAKDWKDSDYADYFSEKLLGYIKDRGYDFDDVTTEDLDNVANKWYSEDGLAPNTVDDPDDPPYMGGIRNFIDIDTWRAFLVDKNEYWEDVSVGKIDAMLNILKDNGTDDDGYYYPDIFYDAVVDVMGDIYDNYKQSGDYPQLGSRGQASVFDNRNADNYLDVLFSLAMTYIEEHDGDVSAVGESDFDNELGKYIFDNAYEVEMRDEFDTGFAKNSKGLLYIDENSDATSDALFEMWAYGTDVSVKNFTENINGIAMGMATFSNEMGYDMINQTELNAFIVAYLQLYGAGEEWDVNKAQQTPYYIDNLQDKIGGEGDGLDEAEEKILGLNADNLSYNDFKTYMESRKEEYTDAQIEGMYMAYSQSGSDTEVDVKTFVDYVENLYYLIDQDKAYADLTDDQKLQMATAYGRDLEDMEGVDWEVLPDDLDDAYAETTDPMRTDNFDKNSGIGSYSLNIWSDAYEGSNGTKLWSIESTYLQSLDSSFYNGLKAEGFLSDEYYYNEEYQYGYISNEDFIFSLFNYVYEQKLKGADLSTIAGNYSKGSLMGQWGYQNSQSITEEQLQAIVNAYETDGNIDSLMASDNWTDYANALGYLTGTGNNELFIDYLENVNIAKNYFSDVNGDDWTYAELFDYANKEQVYFQTGTSSRKTITDYYTEQGYEVDDDGMYYDPNTPDREWDNYQTENDDMFPETEGNPNINSEQANELIDGGGTVYTYYDYDAQVYNVFGVNEDQYGVQHMYNIYKGAPDLTYISGIKGTTTMQGNQLEYYGVEDEYNELYGGDYDEFLYDGSNGEYVDPIIEKPDSVDVTDEDIQQYMPYPEPQDLYEQIANQYWYFDMESFDREKAWSQIQNASTALGFSDTAYLNSINTSFNKFTKDTLSRAGSTLDFDELSDSYKSYIANEYFSMLMMEDGYVNAIDADTKTYDALATGIGQQLEDKDLTEENAEYANYQSHHNSPSTIAELLAEQLKKEDEAGDDEDAGHDDTELRELTEVDPDTMTYEDAIAQYGLDNPTGDEGIFAVQNQNGSYDIFYAEIDESDGSYTLHTIERNVDRSDVDDSDTRIIHKTDDIEDYSWYDTYNNKYTSLQDEIDEMIADGEIDADDRQELLDMVDDPDGGLFATTNPDGKTFTIFIANKNDSGEWQIAEISDNSSLNDLKDSEVMDNVELLSDDDVDNYEWYKEYYKEYDSDRYAEILEEEGATQDQIDAVDTTQDILDENGIKQEIKEDESLDKFLKYGSVKATAVTNPLTGETNLYYYDNGSGHWTQVAENYTGDTSDLNSMTQDSYESFDDATQGILDANQIRGDIETPQQEIMNATVQASSDPRNVQVNNDINIMEQTDNIGEVDLKGVTRPNLNDKFYQNIYNAEHAEPLQEEKYFKYGGVDAYRLNGQGEKLTKKEMNIIKEAFEYDRDITKPFFIKDGKYRDTDIDGKYAVEYVNEYEYYYEMANNNWFEFGNWLDARILEEESRSFISYAINRKIEASTTDISNYLKHGRILDLFHSIDFHPHSRNYNAKQTQKAILDTHELGINNVESFILSSSMCCLFATIIMSNIKKIANSPAITGFESGIESSDFSGLEDNIFSGVYGKGSQIRDAIDNSSDLNDQQKSVLKIIFMNRSFKTMSEYEISNRYGQIIYSYYGSQDDRKHVLENNSGVVLFNLGLVCLAYFACFVDSSESMGVDTDLKSNLIKIISTMLETIYPAEKYEAELIRSIDNLISMFTSEVRNVHRGNTNQDDMGDIMNDVISKMIGLSIDQTETSFNIDQFFNKNTLDHITSNFGLQMYEGVNSPAGLSDFLSDGFVDSGQFNEIVTKMMTTTMGSQFKFNGANMVDVLLMNEAQASAMLLNPKYNILIPLLKPDLIGFIPEKKITVNMLGFGAKILGFVTYGKTNTNVYEHEVKKDIESEPTTLDEEPTFMDDEEAGERADNLNGNTVIIETNKGFEELLKELFEKESDDVDKEKPEEEPEEEPKRFTPHPPTEPYPEEEPKRFTPHPPTEPYPEIKLLNGTHETEYGHQAGANAEELKTFYDKSTPQVYSPNPITDQFIEFCNNPNSFMAKPTFTTERRVMDDQSEWVQVDDEFKINDEEHIEPWKFAGIVEFANNNYELNEQDYMSKFQHTVVNWRDAELKYDFEPSLNREYTTIKNEDTNEIYIVFKGSQSPDDWSSNKEVGTTNILSEGLKLAEYIPMDYKTKKNIKWLGGQLLTKTDHVGFRKAYEVYRDGLMSIIDKRINKSTKVYVVAHSRGDALANLFTEELVDYVNKDNVVYRSFGGIDFRTAQSASRFDKKTHGINIKRYYNEGDPLRWVNEASSFFKTGDCVLITEKTPAIPRTWGESFSDMFSHDNSGDGFDLKPDHGVDKMKAFIKATRGQGVDKFHQAVTYKKILAQDSHEKNYKISNDSSMNWLGGIATGLIIAVAGGVYLYSGYNAIKQTIKVGKWVGNKVGLIPDAQLIKAINEVPKSSMTSDIDRLLDEQILRINDNVNNMEVYTDELFSSRVGTEEDWVNKYGEILAKYEPSYFAESNLISDEMIAELNQQLGIPPHMGDESGNLVYNSAPLTAESPTLDMSIQNIPPTIESGVDIEPPPLGTLD